MRKDLTNLELKFKKPAVDLTDLALGILILGIVVSIGASIMLNYRDSRLTSLDTTSVTNETISPSGGVYTLSNTWVQSIGTVTNTSGDLVSTINIDSGNYTSSISSIDGTGTLDFTSSSYINTTDINVSYSYYDTTGADWALANDASTGLGEYGNWFTIIVIVGIASVILALIFLAFGRPGSQSAGVSY